MLPKQWSTQKESCN